MVKSGLPTDEYSVDGITGGTITSKGVGEMVDRTMGIYLEVLPIRSESTEVMSTETSHGRRAEDASRSSPRRTAGC